MTYFDLGLFEEAEKSACGEGSWKGRYVKYECHKQTQNTLLTTHITPALQADEK